MDEEKIFFIKNIVFTAKFVYLQSKIKYVIRN